MSDVTFDPALELRHAAAYRRLMQQLKQHKSTMDADIVGVCFQCLGVSVSWSGEEEGVLDGVQGILATCRSALRDYSTEEGR